MNECISVAECVTPAGQSLDVVTAVSSTNPILFTPGPVRIPRRVAELMANPPCNYHRQEAFRQMFAANEADLKALIGIRDPGAYFATQITSTGTGANEAVLVTLASTGRGLVINNGFFGARVADQAAQNGLDHLVLELPSDRPIEVDRVAATLDANPDLMWVFFVSHETRMGMVNPLVELGQLCAERGLLVGADVISSAYAYPIDIEAARLDMAVASSAKALQASAGIGIIFVKLASLAAFAGTAPRSYYFDVVAETERQRSGRETRFAQPVPLHASIRAACDHMKEVGIDNHMARVQRQMQALIDHLAGLGIEPMLDAAYRSNIAVNFRLPEGMAYSSFAPRMQAEGYYLLYGIPGDDTHFQLSTIGDLTDEHVAGICDAFNRVFGA